MSTAPSSAIDGGSSGGINGAADPASSSAATTLVIIDEGEDEEQEQQQQQEESGREAGVARHADVGISEGDVADLREAARRASAGAAASAAASAGTAVTHVWGPHVEQQQLHQEQPQQQQKHHHHHHHHHHYDQDQQRDRQLVHELDLDAGADADADAQAKAGEASQESLYYEASTMASLNPFSVVCHVFLFPSLPVLDTPCPRHRRDALAASHCLVPVCPWPSLRHACPPFPCFSMKCLASAPSRRRCPTLPSLRNARPPARRLARCAHRRRPCIPASWPSLTLSPRPPSTACAPTSRPLSRCGTPCPPAGAPPCSSCSMRTAGATFASSSRCVLPVSGASRDMLRCLVVRPTTRTRRHVSNPASSGL